MATRKPIIYASNFVKDWIDKINCGIYALPENPESIAKAIIKLYKMSSEERKKMGQRGREYVEKYHSIPVLVDKLEKVIQEVAQ